MKNCFLLIMLPILLGACVQTQRVTMDTKVTPKDDITLGFNKPQYSMLAFRPSPGAPGFSEKSLAEQKAEISSIMEIMGTGMRSDFPVLTIEDDPKTSGEAHQLLKFTNKENTYYFDVTPTSRKAPYGILMSDGIGSPLVVWGTKGYLKNVKKVFGVASKEDFERLIQSIPQEDESSDNSTALGNFSLPKITSPKEEKALYERVSNSFVKRFLADKNNARFMFYIYQTEGIKMKKMDSYYPDTFAEPTSTSIEYYDKHGMPSRIINGDLETVFYTSPAGLPIKKTIYKQNGEGGKKVSEINWMDYQNNQIIIYKEESGKWVPTELYLLDDQQRIYRKVSIMGKVILNNWYSFDQNGNLSQSERVMAGKKSVDTYEYDTKDRIVSLVTKNYNEDNSEESVSEMTTTYDDLHHTSESAFEEDGILTNRTTIVYDQDGNPIKVAVEGKYKFIYSYEFYP